MERTMQIEMSLTSLRRKREIERLFTAAFGLLLCVAATGCGPSKTPSVVRPTTTANMTTATDANSLGFYFTVDSGPVLAQVNDAWRVWRFTRDAVGNRMDVWNILGQTCGFVETLVNPDHVGVSSRMFAGATVMCNWPSEWLREEDRNEPNKAIVAELLRDPEFVFKGADWTVVVNVFRADGRVERWELAGNMERETRLMRVKRIHVAPLKPVGTYQWPFLG
jgi:hypothetical protein